MNDGRLFGFERRTVSQLPGERLFYDGLNALAICSCVWSHHPGHVIIHEREGTPICVDPVLDKIRIKKRNRIGERGGPWGSPACGSARFVDGCPLTTVA